LLCVDDYDAATQTGGDRRLYSYLSAGSDDEMAGDWQRAPADGDGAADDHHDDEEEDDGTSSASWVRSRSASESDGDEAPLRRVNDAGVYSTINDSGLTSLSSSSSSSLLYRLHALSVRHPALSHHLGISGHHTTPSFSQAV